MRGDVVRVCIWSDLVCPWCYLGKARFEAALAGFEHRDHIEVVHRSFQLDPSLPSHETTKQIDVLERKYGMSRAQAEAAQAEMERMAASEGLEMHLAVTLVGNTEDAHRLVHIMSERGFGDAMVDRLFRAHFTEGRSIFDHESLVDLAEEVGVAPDETRDLLASDSYREAVASDMREARSLGVSGVPFFLIDDHFAVAGAQSAEVFTSVLARAWAEREGSEPAEIFSGRV